ncbi:MULTISPECIES: hypothetical protein [Cellulophaga]|uniref:Chromosome partitioning protein ParA n=2 Tax=Cellulophaga TaxID=104264 RepID=F0RAG0_CELLC|nr:MULTISPECIES: hypothetical protein [Cellulophaga]ADY30523.1 hypothetical protein Celly_2706 [Cellulophaga lytica DSM 7489]AIM61513.1 hypothetical protein IX49_13630 [Cellulophaga lytica]APU11406.1 hypothetical protein A5M85_14295 [Cellulophaga lytica]EWH13956.1 hypothetical protein KLA_06492 [Cellulophaga geojensis KL-A]MDO6853226.1 hypothetical protein [Cellulophaga lytica]
MSEKKSNTGLKVLAVLLGVGLLASIAYTVSLYKDREKTKTVLTQEKEYVVNDLTSLQSEYDKAIMESNATNEELVEARDRIAKYIDSVKTMKTDISSLSRYRRQVDLLKKERAFLLKKVDSLTTSNTMLAMERDSTYQELSRQTVFNDSLVVQNTQLADAVEKGSALNLAKFSVDAVKERNSGKLVSTTRASRADKLKICFTVADNAIAQAGDREFYIEVLDPQGNVLGEGTTKSNETGASLTYSKATAFYYENRTLDICDYVNKPVGDFQKGNYMAIVYDSKLKILGKSEFTLK